MPILENENDIEAAEDTELEGELSETQDETEGEAPDAGQEASEDAPDSENGGQPPGDDPYAGLDDSLRSQFEAIDALKADGDNELADKMLARLEKKLGLVADEPEAPTPPPSTVTAQPVIPAAQPSPDFEWSRTQHNVKAQTAQVSNQVTSAQSAHRAAIAELEAIKSEEGEQSAGYRLQQQNVQAALAAWTKSWTDYQQAQREQDIVDLTNSLAATDTYIASNKTYYANAVFQGYINPQANYEQQIAGLNAFKARMGIRDVAPPPVNPRATVTPALAEKIKALKQLKSPVGGKRAAVKAASAKGKAVLKAKSNADLKGSPYEGIDLKGRF